jgi:hypothetical protein
MVQRAKGLFTLRFLHLPHGTVALVAKSGKLEIRSEIEDTIERPEPSDWNDIHHQYWYFL